VLCLSAQSSFRVMLPTDFVRGYSYFVPVGTLQRKTGLADSNNKIMGNFGVKEV